METDGIPHRLFYQPRQDRLRLFEVDPVLCGDWGYGYEQSDQNRDIALLTQNVLSSVLIQ
jgi:hypothetical protein